MLRLLNDMVLRVFYCCCLVSYDDSIIMIFFSVPFKIKFYARVFQITFPFMYSLILFIANSQFKLVPPEQVQPISSWFKLVFKEILKRYSHPCARHASIFASSLQSEIDMIEPLAVPNWVVAYKCNPATSSKTFVSYLVFRTEVVFCIRTTAP